MTPEDMLSLRRTAKVYAFKVPAGSLVYLPPDFLQWELCTETVVGLRYSPAFDLAVTDDIVYLVEEIAESASMRNSDTSRLLVWSMVACVPESIKKKFSTQVLHSIFGCTPCAKTVA